MRKLLFIFFGFSSLLTWSQIEDAWVYFSDKPDAAYYFEHPLEMLTERALTRRTNQGIALDELDIPISDTYVNQIATAPGILLMAKSKWLNAVHVKGTVSQIEDLELFSFVSSITFANPNYGTKTSISYKPVNKWGNKSTMTDFDYGSAANQIEMLGGDFLHEQGFTGEGMIIAIIDSGFQNVDIISGFARIRNNNQILGTYNFVNDNENVYVDHYHGTLVLSTIAGYKEGVFVGTAPDASFYLFVSEDVSQEHVLEESLWVEAAEEADRLGVDVINTSLGYSEFDNPAHNHSYQDLDGATTFITRGAEIASSRGMIVVNSAGNSGNNEWHYITSPADATSVLTVGAVYFDETVTSFSSFGPTYDGRVKPDVCAQGGAAAVISTNDEVIEANGTSFSSPIMTGVVTCLWQAFPGKTNTQLTQMVKESADRYNTPHEQYGYGIPDFESAFSVYGTQDSLIFDGIEVFPNPIQNNEMQVQFADDLEQADITLIDITGKEVFRTHTSTRDNTFYLPNLISGFYMLTVEMEGRVYSKKMLVD